MLAHRVRLLGARLILALATAALGHNSATPAFAQYLYLDANGDGVNTAADVLAPVGTTTLDLWLKTNRNRDGSTASCATGEDLTINGYEFVLHASNGTVAWSGFANRLTGMTLGAGEISSPAEYHNGYAVGPIFPPGIYHLATLTVAVVTGTPAISIEPTTLSGTYTTSFSSSCPGNDLEYTLKLGNDWFDADGVRYGGTPQAPPVLAPVADMTLSEGETSHQAITATDADQQPLTFSKASGPAYVTVATTDPGQGTAEGLITLAPGYDAMGTATAIVRVTDGIAEDEKSFGITVLSAFAPITIVVPAEAAVSYPGESNFPVSVSDPDGSPLHVGARVAPEYAVIDTRSGVGSYNSVVSLRPSPCDLESGFLVMHAYNESNPSIEASAAVRIALTTTSTPPPSPPPGLFTATFTALPAVGPVGAMASGDLDGDGRADIVAACQPAGVVDVYEGDRDGNLARLERFTGGPVQDVAVADLDGDGIDDLGFLDGASGELVVVRGPLRGASAVSQRVSVGPNPTALRLARMNGDARPDAIVVTNGGLRIAVLMNQGDGTLAAVRSYVSSAAILDLVVADVTGDGALDVVTARGSPDVTETRVNDGTGVLLSPVAHAVQTPTFHIAAGDLNRDGKADLVRICEPQDIQVLLSAGAGAFVNGESRRIGAAQSRVHVVDMNRDGVLDLVHETFPLQIRLGRGDGTFDEPAHYPAAQHLTSLAFPDLDGDGAADVVGGVTRGSTGAIAVYHNHGDGNLDPSPNPTSVGIGGRNHLVDVNNDSRLDIAGYRGVALGRGDGTFGQPIYSDLASFFGPMIVTDLTRDGKPDAVGVLDDGTIRISIGNGNGGFAVVPGPTIPGGFAPDYSIDIAVGDVSGDGIPDLLAGAPYPGPTGLGPIALWRGHGDGTFGARETIAGSNVVSTLVRVRDLDGDGRLDVISNNFRGGGLVMFAGNGDGTFGAPRMLLSATPIMHTPTAIAFGDLNGDGLDDLTMSAYGALSSLVSSLQRPDRTFTPARLVWALQSGEALSDRVDVADFDGDRRLDVAFGMSSMIAVGLGDGQGAFGLRRYFNASFQGGVVALVGDVTSDGRPDILFSGSAEPLRVLVNRSGLSSAPVVTAPDARTVDEGAPLTFGVSATGGGGGHITLSMPASFPTGAAFADHADGTGTFSWTPDFTQGDPPPSHSYTVTFRAVDEHGQASDAQTVITVNNINRGPTANPGGPYTALLNTPLSLDGSGSSDPDGDELTFTWSFGDGETGSGPTPLHTYTSMAGSPYTVTLTVSDGPLSHTATTTVSVQDFFAANVFYLFNLNYIFPQILPTWVRIEPVSGSFHTGEVILPSVTMSYNGATILARCKSIVDHDGNHNGVPEIRVCFTRNDLRALFASLPNGTSDVTVTLAGDLLTGGKFRGSTMVHVIKLGFLDSGALASVSPNPLNPQGTLTFVTTKPGVASVQMFDVKGRLVRNLMAQQDLSPGIHAVTVDGRNEQGNRLASGVYFYRVRSADGFTKGAFTVLK